MDEESRRSFKYGQFAYGKFVYSNEQLREMKNFFSSEIMKHFPLAQTDYII
jgi:spore photoproduct lyase